jgi:hypothetical protein
MGQITFDEAAEKADYYSAIACRAILTALEREENLSAYNRKIVLDSINDFKRNILRFIYEAT